LGTGLNSSQCASPESVACGDRIEDKCGNFCGRGKKDCPEDET
jgi:hypothetical protein